MALCEYLVTLDEDGRSDKIEEGFVWPVRSFLRDIEGIDKQDGKKQL